MSEMTIQNAIHCMKAMICEAVCEECDYYGKTGTDHCEADAVRMAIKALEESERKKGKWIAHEGGKFVGFPYMHYECDQCRAFEPTETNFCPNCGADMRG